jgi:hypothetical protein
MFRILLVIPVPMIGCGLACLAWLDSFEVMLTIYGIYTKLRRAVCCVAFGMEFRGDEV